MSSREERVKEPIIVNSVDVSECYRYVAFNTFTGVYNTPVYEGDCRDGGKCRNKPNCSFKTTVHKNRIIAALKKAVLFKENNRYIQTCLLKAKMEECNQKDERIIELTKEYQRLKEQKDKADRTISDSIGCVSLWEEFTAEESKLAKDSSIADLIMLLRKKTQECEDLQEKLKQNSQAFDKIKRISKDQIKWAFEASRNSANKIIDIIKDVEERTSS